MKGFSDGGVADGWAVRDDQPTHLPPHSSLHEETTGIQKVKCVHYEVALQINSVCKVSDSLMVFTKHGQSCDVVFA